MIINSKWLYSPLMEKKDRRVAQTLLYEHNSTQQSIHYSLSEQEGYNFSKYLHTAQEK